MNQNGQYNPNGYQFQYQYYPGSPPPVQPLVETPEQKAMKKAMFRDASFLGVLLLLYNLFNRIFLNVFYILCYAKYHGGLTLDLTKVKNYLVTEQEALVRSSSFSMTANLFVVVMSAVMIMIIAVGVMKIKAGTLVKPYKGCVKQAFKWMPVCITLNLAASIIIAVFVQMMSESGVTVPEADFTISSPSTYAVVIQFVYVCLIGPVIEELIYRGLVIKLISPYGKGLAVLVSAVIFGIMHGNIPQAASAFAGGLIYAMVAVYCGSIVPSIIIHIINNCFASVMDIGDALSLSHADWVYSAILIILLFAGIYGIVVHLKEMIGSVKMNERYFPLAAKKRYAAVFTNVFILIYFAYMLWEFIKSFIYSNS